MAGGPMPGAPMPVCYNNPTVVPHGDPLHVWEQVVDVVDDYFPIEREDPVRLYGDTLTEGRIDTFPTVSRTILEPWRKDVVGREQVMESTLQSMRRRAVVRVVPGEPGYFIEVAVYKELEDILRPEQATSGTSTFRYDTSLTRVVNPIGAQAVSEGWIPQGRDPQLEQRILADIQQRWGMAGGGR
jgi:hypothetical protein